MDRADKEIVDEAISLVGIESLSGRTVQTLSDGERQKVMIAKSLAQETPVIFLDEPTAFLDMPNRYELCTLLRRLAREENKCVLFSTHELDIALALCDDIALILVSARFAAHCPPTKWSASGCIETPLHGRHRRLRPRDPQHHRAG